MYDVCSRSSFSKLDAWLNELETFSTKHDLIKMLVGNKIDQVGIDKDKLEFLSVKLRTFLIHQFEHMGLVARKLSSRFPTK